MTTVHKRPRRSSTGRNISCRRTEVLSKRSSKIEMGSITPFCSKVPDKCRKLVLYTVDRKIEVLRLNLVHGQALPDVRVDIPALLPHVRMYPFLAFLETDVYSRLPVR